MMEPITATLTTAKEIYEAAKTIQKVYNVSKEMKTVAESEGIDQIMATKNLAGTAADMKQANKPEKHDSKDNNLNNSRDLQIKNEQESQSFKYDFVDIYVEDGTDIPIDQIEKNSIDNEFFVNTLDEQEISNIEGFSSLEKDVDFTIPISEDASIFVDMLSPTEETDIIALSKDEGEINNASNEVKERNPNRFSEMNQYADSERCKEYRSNPDNEPLLEGYDKDANILRHNMELVMNDDASEINKSNSRAHHIVGDNEYSSESKAIIEKYGVDINAPENGIFLPQNESSDLHGTIHEGKHTMAYNDEVTQRLRSAICKEDILEILDSIKEDLYNGDMELYHDHKFND